LKTDAGAHAIGAQAARPPLVFTLSGAAGLIYEVSGRDASRLIFGSTTLAVSTVLAAYMGGLRVRRVPSWGAGPNRNR